MPDRRDYVRSGAARRPARDVPAEFDRLRAPSPAYAPRKVALYLCTREHLVTVPFAAEAETPTNWECRCGRPASLVPDGQPAGAPAAGTPSGQELGGA
jgi:RNA polymerase-binding protein